MLSLLAWGLAAVPLFLLTVLICELLAGLARRRPARASATGTHRAAILMPAHNEAAGIGRIIAAVLPQLGARIQLIVVADNCSDETAAVAHAAGATVIERNDTSKRGKGHALAFGRDWLKQDAPDGLPDCVVVLDADCEMEGDGLARLIDQCCTSGRPVQSCYLLRSHGDDSPMVQISNFAFLIKNRVRQRGATRLGAPAILGGTGMAFPWALFKDAPLATSDLVEDLVLGIDFARTGQPPLYLEDALTWSDPASQQDTRTQRTRWEHGFIHTAFGQGLPLIAEGIGKMRWSLIWLGLHLFVPPLALLMMLGVAAWIGTGLLALLGASTTPFALLFALLALATVALAMAWSRYGREAVSAATLARIPLYLAWKVPVYLKLVRGKESEWVRTKRAGE
jgi:cellulose synthase/poly-beta-1,6-N-acetylglucosamine synthase-like glycosyltransferase